VLPEATVVGLAVRVTTGAPVQVDPPCSVNVPLVHKNVAVPVSGIVESVTDVVLPLEVTPAVPEQLPPHVTACEVQSVVTVMSVHGPQLLFSSSSSITPRLPALLLSAHARAEYVPGAANVLLFEVLELAPIPRALIPVPPKAERLPPPFDAVAIWMKLVNPTPVDAVPWLVIDARSVTETPVLAVIGVIAPATRSGAFIQLSPIFAVPGAQYAVAVAVSRRPSESLKVKTCDPY
jgi:hypothetical protein